MTSLSEEARKVLVLIAEAPLAPIVPLQPIVDELIECRLVTVDEQGRCKLTETGTKRLRQGGPLH